MPLPGPSNLTSSSFSLSYVETPQATAPLEGSGNRPVYPLVESPPNTLQYQPMAERRGYAVHQFDRHEATHGSYPDHQLCGDALEFAGGLGGGRISRQFFAQHLESWEDEEVTRTTGGHWDPDWMTPYTSPEEMEMASNLLAMASNLRAYTCLEEVGKNRVDLLETMFIYLCGGRLMSLGSFPAVTSEFGLHTNQWSTGCFPARNILRRNVPSSILATGSNARSYVCSVRSLLVAMPFVTSSLKTCRITV